MTTKTLVVCGGYTRKVAEKSAAVLSIELGFSGVEFFTADEMNHNRFAKQIGRAVAHAGLVVIWTKWASHVGCDHARAAARGAGVPFLQVHTGGLSTANIRVSAERHGITLPKLKEVQT